MIVHPAHAPLIRREDGITTLHLSEAGGLRQFGCYVETLPPGTRSSERHWHLAEDEALYLLSGTATVVDDCGAHVLTPGDAAIWRRGEPDAHHVQNRSDDRFHHEMTDADGVAIGHHLGRARKVDERHVDRGRWRSCA
jgi:uncharacterized cupin superfamily protein